ncbi:MAG: hypothetical protein ABSA76_12950 [Bacteroidales bacterium]
MIEKIKENINNPEELEKLYRDDKKSFESGFEKIYPEIENSEMAKFWRIRLDFDKIPDKMKRSKSEIFNMVFVCLIVGFLIKIPDLFKINLTNELFYEKNAGIIVFFGLTIYTIWINRNFNPGKLVMLLFIFIVPIVYINLLPSDRDSASINLVYIHMPVLMWCTYGLVFIDFNLKDRSKRIEFIRHNGDIEKAIQLGIANSEANLSQIGAKSGLLEKNAEFKRVTVTKQLCTENNLCIQK